MLFELHLTTDPKSHGQAWKNFCENKLGAKPLLIELSGGVDEHPYWGEPVHLQQMMTASTFKGTDTEGQLWAREQQKEVITAGFPLVRTKLEVPLDKSGGYEGQIEYYETHVKSLIPPSEVSRMVEVLSEAGWHASQNVWYADEDGLEKWYFTQRVYPSMVGQEYTHDQTTPERVFAGREFAESYNTLLTFNWHTVRMESEAVIMDTNPDLDRGWAAA